MRKNPKYLVACLSIFVLLLCSCGGQQPASAPTGATNSMLFLETNDTGVAISGPQIVRSRFVKVNFALLLDDAKRSSQLKTNSEITLNLFPDVTYTGVIDRIEENGSNFAWSGHLKDVELSELTMVFTGGVFIAHFASPGGVYEVSSAEKDLYQVEMIDQTKFPDGGG